MGLFDKMKGIVKNAQNAVQPPPAPQQQAAPPPEVHAQGTFDAPVEESHDDEDGDDWGGWDPNDWEEFWYRLKMIEKAGNDNGDDAADAKCREYGLQNWRHLTRVRETFNRHFGDRHEFVQAAMNAGSRQAREMMQQGVAGNQAILEPVEGISLQVFATTQAKAATVGNDMAKWNQILAQSGMDAAKWDRVNAEWQRRMSGQGGDMNATMALLTEYGKYFGQAGQGQYGEAAAANAGQAGNLNVGQGAAGGEPCTLERYAEIMGAQSAWAQQGRDVNAMLQKQFGMSAIDFSNISQYWSAKIGGDYRIAIKLGELQQQYTQQYMAQGGNLDGDLSV